jgi:choline dehydrogenase-like flavoprotein
VNAKKEVVLAAGAIQTPLLQLSGAGPKSVLQAAGSNFQDHPYATVIFNTASVHAPAPNSLTTNATFNATAWAQHEANKTGSYTVACGNALAFISLPDTTLTVSSVVASLNSQQGAAYLPSFYKGNKKFLKGFAAQKKIIAGLFQRKDAAVAEFPVPADGSYGLVGVEKPLSRGFVHINAKNLARSPDIIHNAFANPINGRVMAIGLRFFRSVWARPELKVYKISETVPGAQHSTDEDIYSALLARASLSPTLAHPSGSCPMMPKDAGGCVSDELLDYGTKRLYAVGASIIPIIPSCHLQVTAYGIGERPLT